MNDNSLIKDPFLEKGEIEFLELRKDEIRYLKFDRFLKVIKALNQRSDKGYQSLMLSVDGFKGNSRELYEIEEFRRYVNLLINQVPQILFYIHDKNKMTNQILKSLSNNSSQPASIDPKRARLMIDAIQEQVEKTEDKEIKENLSEFVCKIQSFVNQY
ncbi:MULTISPECIES: hypothetical protein [Priestia]|jgi:hypothetical protein|uniref:Uncharacterized protein n=6 Tax=Priestia megaterium TaxID=1404 RepID=A0A0L1M8X7_PRIMG|nr:MULTISPECIES: hypothetical protein [Priestia]MCJ7988847.1 hypothetical protein [Priestia sp. OVS21]ADF39147.1 hypothetical protein BMD_2299 [Priestia megaterium DSM 319]AJI24925.1 hypothetical protein BG04_4711 [Priestia megaterium NBRC 15308 = ATCC 14581]KFM96155.1 hypothetical protein DJ91_558 [Priestia megaterium]KGJ73992.1 hypothetical protein BMT_06340 [Priestia megaterium NBRC 15308 = ATCC 14581]